MKITKHKLRYIKEIETIDDDLTGYLARAIEFLIFTYSIQNNLGNKELETLKQKAKKLHTELQDYLFGIQNQLDTLDTKKEKQQSH